MRLLLFLLANFGWICAMSIEILNPWKSTRDKPVLLREQVSGIHTLWFLVLQFQSLGSTQVMLSIYFQQEVLVFFPMEKKAILESRAFRAHSKENTQNATDCLSSLLTPNSASHLMQGPLACPAERQLLFLVWFMSWAVQPEPGSVSWNHVQVWCHELSFIGNWFKDKICSKKQK